MHRRIREYPPTGGASCCAQSFYDPKLMDYGVRLLDRLNWHGVAMVEFRYDTRDHDYKILEVNPKFWGSLDLALASGVDFPYYVCQMANGESIEYSEDYDRSLRFHWPFSGELQLCCVNPRSSWAVLTDCLDPRVRSNLWLSDWRPNVREAMTAIRAGWNRLRGA
jgi:predicted ATP-grasp superfamily ATP-dependent carboligase